MCNWGLSGGLDNASWHVQFLCSKRYEHLICRENKILPTEYKSSSWGTKVAWEEDLPKQDLGNESRKAINRRTQGSVIAAIPLLNKFYSTYREILSTGLRSHQWLLPQIIQNSPTNKNEFACSQLLSLFEQPIEVIKHDNGVIG